MPLFREAEQVDIDEAQTVPRGEVPGRTCEDARRREHRHVGTVFGAGGAVERLDVAASDRAVLGEAFALHDDFLPSGR